MYPPKRTRPIGMCKHCKRLLRLHPRMLCWKCYRDLDVRNRYQGVSAYRGIGLLDQTKDGMLTDGYGTPPLADAPTQAIPGSKDKISIMKQRVERGEAIFHPHDRRDGLEDLCGTILATLMLPANQSSTLSSFPTLIESWHRRFKELTT